MLAVYSKNDQGRKLMYSSVQTREREQRFLLRLQEWFDSTNEIAKAKMVPILLEWATHTNHTNLAGNKYKYKANNAIDQGSNGMYRCLLFFHYLDFSEFPYYSQKRQHKLPAYRRRRWSRLEPLKIYIK